MLSFIKKLFSNTDDSLKDILKSKPFLVDVRSAQEFNSGHVKGSINIPVGTVIANIDKFKNKKQIVVFCRSGNRSAVAKELLNKHGILNVTNGKTWVKINHQINSKNETSNI